ncbi:MAG: glycosyltransferase N-terminal domain-containing protein [Bacteroidales bacterium]
MVLLYNIGIRLYGLMVRVVSAWNPKAAKWVAGRQGWREEIASKFNKEDRVVWFHCASLGEFEQGRPMIEMVRKQYPAYKILLTFFSPSGFEKRKDYPLADHVSYLPLDTRANAKEMLTLVPVVKAIFIKYEFWYNFLSVLKANNIPVYLVSGYFRPSQLFFRWYGGWYRKILLFFTHIFVQNGASAELLGKFDIKKVTVSGDTRFDRVMAIAEKARQFAALQLYSEGNSVIIGGSTWEKDEMILKEAYRKLKGKCKWIIAPHEPSEQNVQRLKCWFPEHIVFSEIKNGTSPEGDIIIVDTIGNLSSLYRYGSLAYIGGGFGKGIHNILEATAAGLPVLFGPNYERFNEAVDLRNAGAAYVVEHPEDGFSQFNKLLGNRKLLDKSAQIAVNYTHKKTGASKIIVDYLFKN